jgi:hypothetical protein
MSRESSSRVVYSFAHQMGDFIHRFGLCGLLNVCCSEVAVSAVLDLCGSFECVL